MLLVYHRICIEWASQTEFSFFFFLVIYLHWLCHCKSECKVFLHLMYVKSACEILSYELLTGHCSWYTVLCTQSSSQHTVCTIQHARYLYSTHNTACTKQYRKYTVQLTQSSTENALLYTQYSLHNAMQKMHSTHSSLTCILPFYVYQHIGQQWSSVHATQYSYSIHSRVPVHRKQDLMTTISVFKDFEILCLWSSQIDF